VNATAQPTTRIGWSRKLVGYAQLAKLRVYQHLYEWLLVVLLLRMESVDPPGFAVALALVLVGMIAVQSAACAADDVVGFRDGSDAENYRSSSLLAAPPKMLPKPLLSGLLTEREGVVFAVGASLVAAAATLGVVIALGGNVPVAAPFGYLVVFLVAVQYSSGLKFSYRPGGLEAVIFLVNAATVLLPYWSIAHRVSAIAVLVGALVGTWFLLVVSYGNAADREGDAAAGRRTFAVLAKPELYRTFLVGLYLASAALTVLPFALGLLRPIAILFVTPLLLLSTIQLYCGTVRGNARQAMRIGFRCIDVGGLGLAAAILVS
jgi:1,4-dihydroxy-2-naphthoate polyprenyltransferase